MEPRNSELSRRGHLKLSGWQAEREEVSDQLVTCKKKPEGAWGWADLGSGSPPS